MTHKNDDKLLYHSRKFWYFLMDIVTGSRYDSITSIYVILTGLLHDNSCANGQCIVDITFNDVGTRNSLMNNNKLYQ